MYTPVGISWRAVEKREEGRLAVGMPSLVEPRPYPDAMGPRTRRKVGISVTGMVSRVGMGS